MNNKAIIAILVIAIIGAGVWFSLRSQDKSQEQTQTQSTTSETTAPAAANATPAATAASVTELKIEELQVGTGTEAKPGKTVSVHYTGTLTDGSKFDSSLDRNQPFSFQLSPDGTARQVIEGWEKGIVGMKVGGKRRLTIPPQMAYGPEGRPPVIPPNATLIFEVQLLSVAD